jgi:hypothetical protein
MISSGTIWFSIIVQFYSSCFIFLSFIFDFFFLICYNVVQFSKDFLYIF